MWAPHLVNRLYFFQITLLKRLENGHFKVQNKFCPFNTRYLAICFGAETDPEPLNFRPAPHPWKKESKPESTLARLKIVTDSGYERVDLSKSIKNFMAYIINENLIQVILWSAWRCEIFSGLLITRYIGKS